MSNKLTIQPKLSSGEKITSFRSARVTPTLIRASQLRHDITPYVSMIFFNRDQLSFETLRKEIPKNTTIIDQLIVHYTTNKDTKVLELLLRYKDYVNKIKGIDIMEELKRRKLKREELKREELKQEELKRGELIEQKTPVNLEKRLIERIRNLDDKDLDIEVFRKIIPYELKNIIPYVIHSFRGRGRNNIRRSLLKQLLIEYYQISDLRKDDYDFIHNLEVIRLLTQIPKVKIKEVKIPKVTSPLNIPITSFKFSQKPNIQELTRYIEVPYVEEERLREMNEYEKTQQLIEELQRQRDPRFTEQEYIRQERERRQRNRPPKYEKPIVVSKSQAKDTYDILKKSKSKRKKKIIQNV